MKDKDERSELRGLLPRGKKARHNTGIALAMASIFLRRLVARATKGLLGLHKKIQS